MAARGALRRRVWLFWISLAYFTCLYWAANGVDGNIQSSGNETESNATLLNCPNDTNQSCDSLPPECLDCDFNDEDFTCVYGRNVTVECSPLSYIDCVASVHGVRRCGDLTCVTWVECALAFSEVYCSLMSFLKSAIPFTLLRIHVTFLLYIMCVILIVFTIVL